MKILKRSILSIFLLVALPMAVSSTSSSAQSASDYRFTLDILRNVEIMVLNFTSDEIKKSYDTAQEKFSEASELFYGQNYDKSAILYKKLKLDLIELTQKIANTYLTRTKDLLDSTSKESFDILIKYSKKSGKLEYFRKPFDPLYDIKPYNEKNYHLYHDRERIENLMKMGYNKYNKAKRIFEDPEIEYLKNRKRITHRNIDFIINKYMNVITLCRESKQCGIEIHKIGITVAKEVDPTTVKRLTPHQLVKTPGLVDIDPIFDGRIPEKYKVDANDNIGLIHEHEVKRRGATPQKYRNMK